jgi:NAD(P)-dependent dehydrogenase (short-subunit alcohol dehydrogenase family)
MKTLDMFRLDGKIAIVTGGYGLYGTHISRGLAESGATVIIASRNEAKCKEYAQALVAEGLSAAGAYLDLSDEASVNDFVDGVAKEYGRIDILVNNAVLREGMADLEDCTVEGWEKAQKVNSTGLMLITKRVIMYMKQQRDGSIINISSIQGVRGPRFVVYEGTNMSSSLNYNIRCNAISPGGYIPQEKPENAPFYENYKKLTPLGRFADDDDIKGPVVFLASKASKYITGDNIMLDGGWTSW